MTVHLKVNSEDCAESLRRHIESMSIPSEHTAVFYLLKLAKESHVNLDLVQVEINFNTKESEHYTGTGFVERFTK